jgi:hypothetical protein
MSAGNFLGADDDTDGSNAAGIVYLSVFSAALCQGNHNWGEKG